MAETLTDWWNSVIYGPDYAVSQDTARALGYDPSTGTFIAPQYGTTFAALHPGVDPGTFVANAQSAAMTQNDIQSQKDWQALGGFSFLPFSPVVGGDAQALKNLTGGLLGPGSLFGGGGDGSGNPLSGILTALGVILVGFLIVLLLIEAVK